MRTTTLLRLVALGAVVLVIGVALCAFDDDGSNDDLCRVSLATAGGTLMVWSFAVIGRPVPGIPETYRLLLADLPSPPPRA
jgi:hypothetical protein